MTHDPHGGSERLPSRLDDEELSPELALVDPDVAERAREALPDITLTEIRLSLSLKIEQSTHPPAPLRGPEVVAVAAAPPAVPAPAPARSPAPAPPPAYDEIRRTFHEPRLGRRRRGRLVLAAVVSLVVAAGVALGVPRALDRQGPQASADRLGRHSSAAAHPATPAQRRKPKRRSTAKPRANKKAAPRRSRPARAVHKAKPAAKRHTSAPSPAAAKPVSKHRPTTVAPTLPAIPEFVWAPAKSASGYLIEFRSGSKLILRARRRAARLHVSRKQLHRGRYRWLVWALNSTGSATGKPLVDSNVRIR